MVTSDNRQTEGRQKGKRDEVSDVIANIQMMEIDDTGVTRRTKDRNTEKCRSTDRPRQVDTQEMTVIDDYRQIDAWRQLTDRLTGRITKDRQTDHGGIREM